MFEEFSKQIEVPQGAGIDGYLKTIESILKLPRVQEVIIRTGRVEYRQFLKPGEEMQPLISVDLSTLMPWAVVRNSTISEIEPVSDNAAVVLGQMFAQCAADGLEPVAFAGSGNTKFFQWYTATTALHSGRMSVHGLPFLDDDNIPSDVLLLCAAYGRGGRLVDTRKGYKVTIPRSYNG